MAWFSARRSQTESETARHLAHRNRSDFCDLHHCDARRRPQKMQRFPRQEKAILHCDLRVRWKVASDLRFQAALSEPKTLQFLRISGDLAPSTRKSLAISTVRFWCAKAQHHPHTNNCKRIKDGENLLYFACVRHCGLLLWLAC